MSLFARREPQTGDEPSTTTPAENPETEGVAGERTLPSINRRRSLQSRVSSALAIGLMAAVGIGVLTWYYSGAITRQSRAEESAKKATQVRVKGEMPLPPLGPVEPPRSNASQVASPALETVLGPPPELPDAAAQAAWRRSDTLLQSTRPTNVSPGSN